MRNRTVRILLRTAFGASIFMFGSASSCDAGQRAGSGECPSGEVCDPATEDGLHFGGPIIGEGFFDVGDVKTLAIGGRQDVTLFEVDDRGRHVDLSLPYDARFDSSGISIEGTRDNIVSLRATAGANGLLRILSRDSGELFDRTTVQARAIASIRLVPTLNVLLDDGGDTALYAPGAVGYMQLQDDRGLRLVDEDATITGVEQGRWDQFVVGALAPGMHSLSVTAGNHAPVSLAFEVGHADSLVHVLGQGIPRDGKSITCFSARSGARQIHAAFTFEADGGTIEPSEFAGCVMVSAGTGDQVVVRAFADGLQASFDLPVLDSSNAAPRRRINAHAAERLRDAGSLEATTTAGDRALRR